MGDDNCEYKSEGRIKGKPKKCRGAARAKVFKGVDSSTWSSSLFIADL